MLILHYVYLPRLNHVIESFTNSWNNHPLRTERNWCSIQLWSSGMIDQRNSHITHIAEVQDSSGVSFDDLEWYGSIVVS